MDPVCLSLSGPYSLSVTKWTLSGPLSGPTSLSGPKAATKNAEDGRAVHSFVTLLEDLATLCRITVRPAVSGASTFNKLAEPTSVQAKLLGLLGVTP